MERIKDALAALVMWLGWLIENFIKYVWPGFLVIFIIAFAIHDPKSFCIMLGIAVGMFGLMWLREWARIQHYQAKERKRYEAHRKHWSDKP
jgi:hypothetical protein